MSNWENPRIFQLQPKITEKAMTKVTTICIAHVKFINRLFLSLLERKKELIFRFQQSHNFVSAQTQLHLQQEEQNKIISRQSS
mmetsp:Transcript_6156/g.18237  ORF Transcript_6156/g.18237 Transcript_6156/m.18237 type:complete len:83 (-) Transcript_6156:466-714(-)